MRAARLFADHGRFTEAEADATALLRLASEIEERGAGLLVLRCGGDGGHDGGPAEVKPTAIARALQADVRASRAAWAVAEQRRRNAEGDNAP